MERGYYRVFRGGYLELSLDHSSHTRSFKLSFRQFFGWQILHNLFHPHRLPQLKGLGFNPKH